MTPPVLIVHAPGTNRDREALWACQQAGGRAEIVHLAALVAGDVSLSDHAMVVFPGGFSYGDDLGAGRVWAASLRPDGRFGEALRRFIDDGKPVLGICNGFQTLVKAGVLPGVADGLSEGEALAKAGQQATLTHNESAQFECRWVWLRADPESPCVFTKGLGERLIHCPVAHGEGRVVLRSDAVKARVRDGHLGALRYARPDGAVCGAGDYPANPNGSWDGIAGLTNAAGNVLGLMPHPEDHIVPRQHPTFHRGGAAAAGEHLGRVLFERGIAYAAGL